MKFAVPFQTLRLAALRTGSAREVSEPPFGLAVRLCEGGGGARPYGGRGGGAASLPWSLRWPPCRARQSPLFIHAPEPRKPRVGTMTARFGAPHSNSLIFERFNLEFLYIRSEVQRAITMPGD